MLLHLAEQLNVPLRERNQLLLAAGYAPMFNERPLQDPALDVARRAVERVLRGHEPYPAIAVDRHWTLLSANSAVPVLLEGVTPSLLDPPVNVLRLALHPEGLAARTLNFPEWRRHLLYRLHHEAEERADKRLLELLTELQSYPNPEVHVAAVGSSDDGGVFVPLQIMTRLGVLSFISTTTVFSGPVDVTVAEMTLECFFPADPETARRLADAAR
jgi:hypothetical protein